MLQILRNEYFDRVITDILWIAPDKLLEVEYKTGIVFLDIPTLGTIGSKTVSELALATQTLIGVRGGSSEFSAVPKPGFKLRDMGGFTEVDSYTDPRQIEIVYDVAQCGGAGAWVDGLIPGDKIDLPTHVVLLHEMRHAVYLLERKFTGDLDAMEQYAIEGENEYRKDRGLPLRGGHGGGCKKTVGFWEGYQAAGGGANQGCFVATAAYGSELDPDVEFLRRFRDDMIRATRTGERFWDRYWERYQRLSPTIVEMIEQDPELRELVRWSLVEPLVHYLELVVSFPDDSLTGVPEPWAGWLEGQRAQLSRWLGGIELPTEFEGMEPDAVVSELAFLLRYVLRTAEARDRYVARLREGGALPLRVRSDTHERLSERLAATPATAERVDAILERHDPRTTVLRAYGDQEVFSENVDLGEWEFSVSVVNDSTETYTVVVYYRRTDIAELLSEAETDVGPGDRVWFALGTCAGLQSYVLGCYIGDELVVHQPEVGEQTPDASLDGILCADLWEIVPP